MTLWEWTRTFNTYNDLSLKLSSMCVYMCAHMKSCTWLPVCAEAGRVSQISLELELQAVGNWVVEMQDSNSSPLKGNQVPLPAEPSPPCPLCTDILKCLTVYFL